MNDLDPHASNNNSQNCNENQEVVNNDNKDLNNNSVINVDNIPMRTYLDNTVMPVLLQGMSELAKERPSDPIEFLAKFMLKHSNENNNS